MSRTYKVYVIQLRRKVFKRRKKFRKANPDYNLRPECFYVGMTSKTPEVRFLEHIERRRNKKGHKLFSTIAADFGFKLRPDLYEKFNEKPMNREEAEAMEAKLAEDLRAQGYGVWYN